MPGRRFRRMAPMTASVALALAGTGCGLVEDGDNLVAGKQAFVTRCGSCHTLSRAGTTGGTGPNLDAAFRQARVDGLGESTFRGMVHGQIANPARLAQRDPQSGKALPLMPANLVKGETAKDVAAYLATAVAKPGEDTGALARIGAKRSDAVAKEDDGTLKIPAAPDGSLAYQFASATAKAGKITLQSTNRAPIGHDIAIEGQGVEAKGAVVAGGGVSKIDLDLKPGTYTFFCSVPGHREGGMVGKLTVK